MPSEAETEIKPEEIPTLRRHAEITRLDDYYRSKQYRGLPDWWTGDNGKGESVPLRERAPCVVYPLPKAIINQATRFTFGEGRFPEIKAEEIDSDHAVALGATLTADEADELGRFIGELVERCHIRALMQALLRAGLYRKTAVVVLSIRAGRFSFDTPRAQDCWPTFKDDGSGELAQLVWCYRFDKLVRNIETKKLEYKPHYFRRDITAERFIVYADAPIEQGKTIVWVEDTRLTVVHGFGFCPARWIRNLANVECTDTDGVSLIEDLLPEFDSLNFALSQRHRGITYFGAPQSTETGIDPDDQVGSVGRTAVPVTRADGSLGYDDVHEGAFGVAPARKKAPDEIWSAQSKDARFGIVETSGKAFEAATNHVRDIRSRVLEAADVVLMDPSEVAGKGELSGVALERIFAPLLALVSELRECWWPQGLEALVQMMLRALVARGADGIYIPLAGKVAGVLKRFMVETDKGTIWVGPRLSPQWGKAFTPSAADVQAMVTAAKDAKEGTLVSAETATRFIAPVFGVKDPAAEVEELDEEQADKLAAMNDAMHGPADAGGTANGDAGADGTGSVAGDTAAA